MMGKAGECQRGSEGETAGVHAPMYMRLGTAGGSGACEDAGEEAGAAEAVAGATEQQEGQQQEGEEAQLPPQYAQLFRMSVLCSPANSQEVRQVTVTERVPLVPGQPPAKAHKASVEAGHAWMDNQLRLRERGKHLPLPLSTSSLHGVDLLQPEGGPVANLHTP